MLFWSVIALFGFIFPHIKRNPLLVRRQSTVSSISAEECDGSLRLDSFISQKYAQFSRSRIATMCEHGLVKVNDKIRSKAFKISKGDNISIIFEELQLPNVNPENISLDVIYEDPYLLAVNKANGMVVHPSVGTPNGTFVNALLYYYQQKNLTYSDLVVGNNQSTTTVIHNSNEDDDESIMGATEIPLSLRPGIVHRLDKGTTGVLLAGKSFEAVEKLSSLFANRRINKYYLAICVGHPGNKTISQSIGRSRKNRQIMCGVAEVDGGKMAVTHTRTLAFNGKLSLVLIKIDTGRTHQIRVHMKEKYTPILGDEFYGNINWNNRYAKSHQIQRPLLHAYHIHFPHPLMRRRPRIHISAPLPVDMLEVAQSIINSNIDPYEPNAPLIDENTGLLRIEHDKLLKLFQTSSLDAGPVPNKMFVPSDRIRLEEEENDDWSMGNIS